MAVLPAAPFTCVVVRAHDDDGPLWCSKGIRVRIAGVQAPDYEGAEPCRRPDARRANYTCDNAAADRSRQIVQRVTLRQTMTCQSVGASYSREVARCTLPDGRSLSCAVIATGEKQVSGFPLINYVSGALENPAVRQQVCNILEGGNEAFLKRDRRYAIPRR